MRTVKSLREELRKFPDDAQCFAYEGEVSGLVIKHPYYRNQGVIHCGEEERKEGETRLLSEDIIPEKLLSGDIHKRMAILNIICDSMSKGVGIEKYKKQAEKYRRIWAEERKKHE